MRNSPWKVMTYAVIIIMGVLIALPNILSEKTLAAWPSWLPSTKISLGLDLRGGSHLVLEVDRPSLEAEWLQNLTQDARNTLELAKIPTTSIRREQNNVVVTVRDPSQKQAAQTELAKLVNQVTWGTSIGVSDLDIAPRGDSAITLHPSEVGLSHRISGAVDQSLEIIRQRVDQVGVAEPTIQRVGADRVLVQLPGEQDPSHLKQLLGSTAKMSFHLLGRTGDRGVSTLQDEEGQSYPVEDRVLLSGDRLTDARVAFDPNNNQPVVSFRFDQTGATRFADITRQNVGNPFAIVLDGKVLSAPVIREPITGGAGQISGSFTVEGANTLAALLRAGALPAKD